MEHSSRILISETFRRQPGFRPHSLLTIAYFMECLILPTILAISMKQRIVNFPLSSQSQQWVGCILHTLRRDLQVSKNETIKIQACQFLSFAKYGLTNASYLYRQAPEEPKAWHQQLFYRLKTLSFR